jgi:hypothetical protein
MMPRTKTALATLISISAFELQAQTADPDAPNRSGFFIGVQAGTSSLRERTDHSFAAAGSGNRWRAGSVGLLGLEVHRGNDKSGFGGIGLNARFNFGPGNPVFGRVTAGLSLPGTSGGPLVFGGLGVGVDLNRYVSLNVAFTTHAQRRDTTAAGLEVRF